MNRPARGRPSRPWGTRLALLYFALSTAALVWPIYPWLGNHIEPRLVLGLPWSLTWVLLVIAANFIALVVLYRLRVVDDRELDELDSPSQPTPSNPLGEQP
ncbi:hypothetical protein G6O69_06675 [Pseudenhygromyxa sp. WMMC2535]|uniref:hypothetical protein n=1 Tax=Pseudenhygromyxa sp. WMMC2535 TaxID=2712867 RepID=UPI001555A59D|nr:hypothetical protein [Pseudenhygromyxa sp. WMMC2535]NVB37510.1 hypothetical protein [Pseudenhygromyxa sp. WMMC2535]